MAATTIVWIVFVVLWAAVLVGVLFQLVRAAVQAKRLSDRVGAYAELPVVKAAAGVEGDLARLEAALTAVEPLIERARLALATIRRGPFPEPVRAAYATARRNLADFNRLRG